MCDLLCWSHDHQPQWWYPIFSDYLALRIPLYVTSVLLAIHVPSPPLHPHHVHLGASPILELGPAPHAPLDSSARTILHTPLSCALMGLMPMKLDKKYAMIVQKVSVCVRQLKSQLWSHQPLIVRPYRPFFSCTSIICIVLGSGKSQIQCIMFWRSNLSVWLLLTLLWLSSTGHSVYQLAV